jgi:hypothetical protein
MGIFRLIKNDNLVAGEHVVGRGDEQKVYKPGELPKLLKPESMKLSSVLIQILRLKRSPAR